MEIVYPGRAGLSAMSLYVCKTHKDIMRVAVVAQAVCLGLGLG